jgi:type VI secretion system protein ImpK
LLDESVLKMQNPAFADWAQRPLQEEMFGHNRAGEVFFQHLGTLLARPDSQETADCLEVYCLCMLLGFKGQYAIDPDGYGRSRGAGDVQNITRQAREKIDRIRGKMSFLPDAPPPSEVRKVPPVDRWSRGLGGAVLILLVLALLAYGGFWFQLHTGALQIS